MLTPEYNEMNKIAERVHFAKSENMAVIIKQMDQDLSKSKESEVKWPIVFTEKYCVKFGGLEKFHPFDASKGHHILKFLKPDFPLTRGQFHEPMEVTQEELLKVHTRKYLKSLKWSINAARISEILPLILLPNLFVQRGYLRPMRFQTAGSILAGKLALETGWAINLGGGFHHCCSYRGAGFCAYADITLLINRLFLEEQSISKAMIVDLDAHQGNGHERDFQNEPNVFILDMFNAAIYPRDHAAKLNINCAVELMPHTEDQFYLKKLRSCLQRSLEDFQPDIVVYNGGTDILKGDPLGLLEITPEGIIERDEFVFSICQQKHIPIVMLLSGGYLKLSAKVIADSIFNLKQKGLLKIN